MKASRLLVVIGLCSVGVSACGGGETGGSGGGGTGGGGTTTDSGGTAGTGGGTTTGNVSGSAKPECADPGSAQGPTPDPRSDTAGALNTDGTVFLLFGGDTAIA